MPQFGPQGPAQSVPLPPPMPFQQQQQPQGLAGMLANPNMLGQLQQAIQMQQLHKLRNPDPSVLQVPQQMPQLDLTRQAQPGMMLPPGFGGGLGFGAGLRFR